ncbi:uncharacterized protein with ParB-like and HNH nuclease domain [Aurantimicrobium minutum]|uniref:DUF262 domain-containing protein n=1 Tax=Aurantimicrobium minutum TaxID=708131 RepID=UPI002474D2EB|nr:DUF262 domain-containing HNH endonuclease family protein [Aurantimicrobium minutum]MDH6277625.1 uncharacterized protein with ParB-like and HNH nuclease domain [Aurantimicrobium minutum]
MQIDASEKSLHNILSGNVTLTIPPFQRNYAWKTDQIDAYLEDVFNLALDPGSEHFFGPVVLLEDKKDLSIIDGQQRLTTTIILLCIIRDQLESFTNSNFVKEGHNFPLDMLLTQMLKHDDFIHDSYIANYQIQDVFKTHILAPMNSVNRKVFNPGGKGLTTDEKRATTELRSAYSRIQKRLNDWLKPNAGDEDAMKSQLFSLINALRNGFRLLEIRMYTADDAYILFETLNERGLRLTPSDLLKNFTLRNVAAKDSDKITKVLKQWDDSISTLGDYPFTKFLRHFLLSSQVSKVQAQKIFKLFSDRVAKYGDGGAMRNLNEIESAANVYAKLLGDSSNFGDSAIDDANARLNLFSETHRVFLLRVMLGSFTNKAKLKATLATEIMAFRWILTGRNAQELETLYQKASDLLFTDNQGTMAAEDSAIDAAISFLMSSLPSDDAVRSYMIENPARRDLVFYALKRANFAIQPVGFNYQQSKLHVEHLAPQNPAIGSSWFTKVAERTPSDPNAPTYDDFVQKWGNLSILEFEVNISISNADWTDKVNGKNDGLLNGLKNSLIQMNKDLSVLPDWTADLIDKRTAWLADAMVALTRPENIEGTPGSVSSYTGN